MFIYHHFLKKKKSPMTFQNKNTPKRKRENKEKQKDINIIIKHL